VTSFAIYQLRTAYLAHIQDGVGERLINVDTTFLNDPSFRAAGWSADSAEVKRTYSPPIPAAITSEYFQAPPLIAGGDELGEDEDGDGGPEQASAVPVRRRKRREQLEEDDSSDLSDESEDESEIRPLGQVRFNKMPTRIRSGSSPIRSSSIRGEPSELVTSPAKPDSSRPRGSSLSAVELMKTRTRRDTATSSEFSADSELDPSVFQRRILKSRPSKAFGTLSRQVEEDEDSLVVAKANAASENALDSDPGSLISDFSETLGQESLLAGALHSSPRHSGTNTPGLEDSTQKRKRSSIILAELPPPRPISTIQPKSLLSMALQAHNKKPTDPFERFATLSGAADPNPLYLKIYAPATLSSDIGTPMEILIRKVSNEGEPVTVAEAIGFSLWKYGDEDRQPTVTGTAKNVNRWTFRVVEDEEIDDDFPPLVRTKPMSDFTSNNRRAAGRRARGKPWDEFALVQASDAQFQQNEIDTPVYSEEANGASGGDVTDRDDTPVATPVVAQSALVPNRAFRGNYITDPYFGAAQRKESEVPPADAPATMSSHATPRAGASRSLNIHFTSNDYTPRVMTIDTTTDTYLAEVFDQACRKLNLDKALYMLRVSNTTTIAPTDRTVEALGPIHSDLDLVRRRFIGDGGTGTFGSPSSTSPNAPILGTPTTGFVNGGANTPRRNKNKDNVTTSVHPLAQQHSAGHPHDPYGGLGLGLSFTVGGSGNKRYNVIRKQPMSLAPSHPRVLELSGDYLHILPADPITTNRALYDPVQNKTTSVHFSSVVGCKVNRKHPKTFRLVIYREKESKRYDFEVDTVAESQEIVDEICKGMEATR
jgi:hypothetical protein